MDAPADLGECLLVGSLDLGLWGSVPNLHPASGFFSVALLTDRSWLQLALGYSSFGVALLTDRSWLQQLRRRFVDGSLLVTAAESMIVVGGDSRLWWLALVR